MMVQKKEEVSIIVESEAKKAAMLAKKREFVDTVSRGNTVAATVMIVTDPCSQEVY